MADKTLDNLDLGADFYDDERVTQKGPGSKKKKRTGRSPKKRAAARKAGSAGSAKKKKKRRHSPWWSWPVAVIMLGCLLGLGLAVVYERGQYETFTDMRRTVSLPGFYPGITIDGRDVTGASLEDVLNRWRGEDEARRASYSIALRNGGKQWTVNAEKLDYQSDYDEVIRRAWDIGHLGTVQERYREILELREVGCALSTSYSYDDTVLSDICAEAAETLTSPAVDADVVDFDVETQVFSYSEEAFGTYVDAEALHGLAVQAFASEASKVVDIVQEPVFPKVTRADLAARMGQCSTFYTDVAGSGARRNNVRLATETLNGVCIMPGEVFSYNATIGKRTEEKGYREAPVYANGLSATEPGGGVCQVSSTLFNAVLLADLNIVSRSPHSRPASYVPVGLDATVSWPEPDFKFQNDTPYPVYIVSKYENEKCYMSIYGQQLPDGMYVTMEAVTTEVLKSDKPVYIYTKDLPKGQQHTIAKAREGYLAEAYKVYHYADGTEMDRMLYIRSEYPAVGPTIRVGS